MLERSQVDVEAWTKIISYHCLMSCFPVLSVLLAAECFQQVIFDVAYGLHFPHVSLKKIFWIRATNPNSDSV